MKKNTVFVFFPNFAILFESDNTLSTQKLKEDIKDGRNYEKGIRQTLSFHTKVCSE